MTKYIIGITIKLSKVAASIPPHIVVSKQQQAYTALASIKPTTYSEG